MTSTDSLLSEFIRRIRMGGSTTELLSEWTGRPIETRILDRRIGFVEHKFQDDLDAGPDDEALHRHIELITRADEVVLAACTSIVLLGRLPASVRTELVDTDRGLGLALAPLGVHRDNLHVWRTSEREAEIEKWPIETQWPAHAIARLNVDGVPVAYVREDFNSAILRLRNTSRMRDALTSPAVLRLLDVAEKVVMTGIDMDRLRVITPPGVLPGAVQLYGMRIVHASVPTLLLGVVP
jgi:chorismate-pyruvate lyase